MKRIDRETVQKILDTADIVDVVSDFVSLKRRGANYIGLCPFHNERTPSFSVSKSKGICKCFSCGKGGSAVNFIMEHEQLSFNEALKYLAKKYNIEIKEHELTDAQREQASIRENMLAVNEFAMDHFEKNLLRTNDGKEIGYAYFRERGINDSAIARFHLGYALEKSTDLYQSAIDAGYNETFLVDTGLCIKTDTGRFYDRFKGRVIYPVFSISGKVLAFGGRTLRNDKNIAKYVNSPESPIYSKSRELYGLYQAKQAIAKKNKCILVEGYMDVISMSQSGIENVVASSGTSLTEGQIRLIHRFTDNVTVIYDSDAAGIKASLRGIDMLLAEELNIKVVLLPDGDDPDSFAQSHSSTEVEEYISKHETDFIRFKTRILLDGTENDPLSRSSAITDIVRSISVIPNEITRSIYIKECSRTLEVDEKILTLQIAKFINERREKQLKNLGNSDSSILISGQNQQEGSSDPAIISGERSRTSILEPFEKELIRYILKYGMIDLPALDEDGQSVKIHVIDYVTEEMNYDNLNFTNETYHKIFDTCRQLVSSDWENDYASFNHQSLAQREQDWRNGENLIRQTAATLDQIKIQESQLKETIDLDFTSRDNDFRLMYFIKNLTSSPDDAIRLTTTDLVSSRHKLSKVHSKFSKIDTEQDRLEELLPQAIFGLKDAVLQCEIKDAREQLRQASARKPANNNEIDKILSHIAQLDKIRQEYAKYLGERVVAPK